MPCSVAPLLILLALAWPRRAAAEENDSVASALLQSVHRSVRLENLTLEEAADGPGPDRRDESREPGTRLPRATVAASTARSESPGRKPQLATDDLWQELLQERQQQVQHQQREEQQGEQQGGVPQLLFVTISSVIISVIAFLAIIEHLSPVPSRSRAQGGGSAAGTPDEDGELRGEAVGPQLGPQIPEASAARGVLGLFKSQAMGRSNNLALVDAEGGTTITYLDLAKASGALASLLSKATIGNGDVVGLLLEPSCRYVVATLGVMQAGGCWLPLDLKCPEARLQRLLCRAGARLGLAAEGWPVDLVAPVPVWALGAGGEVSRSLRRPDLPPRTGAARAPGLSAVFYTSGSTGEPKAVMYGQEVLCHGALTFARLCRADCESVFLVKTPTFWAVTEYEVFAPLAVGAAAVVDARAQTDVVRLAQTVRRHCVSVLVTSAPVLRLLADEQLPTLRHAVNVGAPLPMEVCDSVQKAFGPSLSIHNLYGCTETPCLQWTSGGEALPSASAGLLAPAGVPQPGVEVYIFDAERRPVALGVVGEVYIGGPFLSRGYLDDELLTRERFLPSPSGKGSIYRTGDCGRWVLDARSRYILRLEGRADRQLNIKGVRVAPEEVEAVLSWAEGVHEVAVVVVGDEGYERIVACAVGREDDLARSLSDHAGEQLPPHMRPSGFLLMDALPKLSAGKVDYASLSKRASKEMTRPADRPEEVEAVDSLGRMKKVKKQVRHDLQVMSAMRAWATVGVILYHWYWEHWVDYTHHDGIVVPSLRDSWDAQGSWWYKTFVKGAIGIMPWTMPVFVTLSGYADSIDGTKSKLSENVMGVILYIACYWPLPQLFMWVLRVPLDNRGANLEFWQGNHRWYLVYYLFCNLLHSWLFLPLRAVSKRATSRTGALAPAVAVTAAITAFCVKLWTFFPMRRMCGSAPVPDWRIALARWLLPRVKQHGRGWICVLLIPSQLHLFIAYTVAWWFGPCFVAHLREAAVGKWLAWFGALLPASLFLCLIFGYMHAFPVEAPTEVYRHWSGVVCCYLVIWSMVLLAKKPWFPLRALAWLGNCSLATYIFHLYWIIRPSTTQSMTFFRYHNRVLIMPPEEAVAAIGAWPGSDVVKILILTAYPVAYMATFGRFFQQVLLLIPVLGSSASKHLLACWSWLRFRASAPSAMLAATRWRGSSGPASPAWQRLRARLLDAGGVACLDGGTGSELERRARQSGRDEESVNRSGWSCLQWRTHPELLQEVHESYLRQGANIITANSYATNRHIMQAAGYEDLAVEGTLAAVRLACKARDHFRRTAEISEEEPLLVAGSVSCHPPGMAHGASMDKGQWPAREVETAGYHEQAQLLRKGGADMIFVEMVWEWKEHGILAARGACSAGLPVAVCLAVFDAESCDDDMPILHDGTLVEEVARELCSGEGWENVVAICIHHTKLPMVLPCLLALRRGGWDGFVGAYPDHGTFQMPHWVFEPLEASRIVSHVEQWVEQANCKMVGGCCGIGPETIKEISKWCCTYNARRGCTPCGSTTVASSSASSASSSSSHSWEREWREALVKSAKDPAQQLPILVLGAGLSGLAAARECQRRDCRFLLVDKSHELGGCWTAFGNRASKLQSDSGSYDVELDQPHSLPAYPSKDELMAYVQSWLDKNNLGEHTQLGTEVTSVVRAGGRTGYVVHCAEGQQQCTVQARAVLAAPGRLRRPVRQTLEGEQAFHGSISYGLADDLPVSELGRKEVVILGHGSFAIECMRSCLEGGAAKVTLLCRTRNVVLPRAVRLAISRRFSSEPCSAHRVLELCGPAYRLLGIDCFSLATVATSRDSTVCLQQTQPAVSDLYFLAQHCGVVEVVLDTVSHLLAAAVCTKSSRRQLPADALVKCLGFETGDPQFDKVLGLERMLGFWADGDAGRFVLQEPVGKVAFTTWPIPYANPHFVYLFYFFRALQDGAFLGGLLSRLPVCASAAYDGAHARESFRALLGGLDENALQELTVLQDLPAQRARQAHPWGRFLEEQRAEWEAYARSMGAKDVPEYPFHENALERFEEEVSTQSGHAHKDACCCCGAGDAGAGGGGGGGLAMERTSHPDVRDLRSAAAG